MPSFGFDIERGMPVAIAEGADVAVGGDMERKSGRGPQVVALHNAQCALHTQWWMLGVGGVERGAYLA